MQVQELISQCEILQSETQALKSCARGHESDLAHDREVLHSTKIERKELEAQVATLRAALTTQLLERDDARASARSLEIQAAELSKELRCTESALVRAKHENRRVREGLAMAVEEHRVQEEGREKLLVGLVRGKARLEAENEALCSELGHARQLLGDLEEELQCREQQEEEAARVEAMAREGAVGPVADSAPPRVSLLSEIEEHLAAKYSISQADSTLRPSLALSIALSRVPCCRRTSTRLKPCLGTAPPQRSHRTWLPPALQLSPCMLGWFRLRHRRQPQQEGHCHGPS